MYHGGTRRKRLFLPAAEMPHFRTSASVAFVRPSGASQYLACPDCDALYEAPPLKEGEQVLCTQCGASLFHYHTNSVNRAAALTIAAGFLFLVSNFFPFMTLQAGYRESQMVFSQSVSGLEKQGYPFLGGVVASSFWSRPR